MDKFTSNLEKLLPDSSRKTADIAAQIILLKQSHIEKTLELLFQDKGKLSMRTSSFIGICIENQLPSASNGLKS